MFPLTQHINNRPTATAQHISSTSSVLTAPQQAAIYDYINQCLNNSTWYCVQCCTADKAAEVLSVEVSTIRDWIKSGKLAASKVGNSYLIRLVEIDRMLHKNATIINIDHRRKTHKK